MRTEKNLLSDLLSKIQGWNNSCNQYFNYIGQYEALCPVQHLIQSNLSDRRKPPVEEFFAKLGIRSLAINNFLNSFILPKSFSVHGQRNKTPTRWHDYKITSFIEDLKRVFRNCWVIAFSDWAIVNRASELWQGLLFDVIKPLDRKDYNFIFHLGDPTKKPGYEVDEILDIISNFSCHGQVTLILTEQEATRLWMILQGQNDEYAIAEIPGLTEKYQVIFDALHISHLLIYAADHATLISGQQQYEFSGRSFTNSAISKEAKDNFNAGYSLGLLLQLEISQCVALGLIVSGAYLENRISPDRKALLSYIRKWIGELKTPTQ
jgi:hypothetical protein